MSLHCELIVPIQHVDRKRETKQICILNCTPCLLLYLQQRYFNKYCIFLKHTNTRRFGPLFPMLVMTNKHVLKSNYFHHLIHVNKNLKLYMNYQLVQHQHWGVLLHLCIGTQDHSDVSRRLHLPNIAAGTLPGVKPHSQ